jgi:transposase-like protein
MGTAINKRVFARDFKLSIARQLVSGQKRLSQVCRENSLCETVVRRWKLQYERDGENAWTQAASTSTLSKTGKTGRKTLAPSSLETPDEAALLTGRVKELEAALGRAHLEIELLKLALEKKPSPLARGSR